MAIWTYERNTRVQARGLASVLSLDNCPFCATSLTNLGNSATRSPYSYTASAKIIDICAICGFWRIRQDFKSSKGTRDEYYTSVHAATATLRELDLSDISVPLQEARTYLVAKYDARFEMHPRLFEETVASVFKDLGYQVVVTGYSSDGGIDVILHDDSGTIGVQVKRYKNSIEVEQIRSLTGALVLAGFTKGIFVTTSRFQAGAPDTVQKYSSCGYQIDLVDADRFYETLRLTQRPQYNSVEEFASKYGDMDLTLVAESDLPGGGLEISGKHITSALNSDYDGPAAFALKEQLRRDPWRDKAEHRGSIDAAAHRE